MVKTKKQRRKEKRDKLAWKKRKSKNDPLFCVFSNWPSRGYRGRNLKNLFVLEDATWNYVQQFTYPLETINEDIWI